VSVALEVDAVIEEIRSAQKFLLTTHENPDGDALGSLLGMHELLKQLGKDSVMFLAAEEFPLPWEYRKMPLDEVQNEPPADLDERTVVFLDCGNIDRMPVDFLQRDGVHIVNVDHHHDNTRFGTVNLVDAGASCTAQIIWELTKELGAEITPAIGDALYVGLVTDTGKFMYTNTSARSHRMAAELMDSGIDAHGIYRRLYEELPFARLLLLSRALNRVERFDDGVVTATYLTRADFEETGSVETDSEGIVDHLRAVDGTKVAVLVRELLADDRTGIRKLSLRATDGTVDVSRIARGLGGGGHRQAAGASSELPLDELMATIRKGIQEQL
jgi:bifunctional oligoribonuclease and PAP phosphatase NrnA